MSTLTRKRTILSSGWQYKLADSNGVATPESNPKLREWAAVSTFPSVVQLELLNRKLIPDPNVGENERLIQWVGEADWEYLCSFPSPSEQSASDSCFVDLLFEGLDTFATVMLNGRVILQSDNMFLPQRVDVKGALKESGSEDNALVILFESAVKKGRELEEKYGARKSMMRDKKRMQMRKAQVNSHSYICTAVPERLTGAKVSLGLGLGPHHPHQWPISPNPPRSVLGAHR
jgi:beta-mannosidase